MSLKAEQCWSYPVEVDDHGPVAHLGRFVVRVPDRGERHLRAARAHRDPERGARGVRGRVRVAHHQTLALQDDGFRVVLGARRAGSEPHGTEQTQGQHTGAAAAEPAWKSRATGLPGAPRSSGTAILPKPRSARASWWLEGEKCALSGLSGATFSSSPSFGARHWGAGSAEGSDGSRTAGDAQQLIARAELRLLSAARA